MSLDGMTKDDLVLLLQQAVRDAVEAHPLSDEEIQWVRMAIEAEAKRAAFRKAVIEKTFIGLVSSALLGLCMYAVEFFRMHWK